MQCAFADSCYSRIASVRRSIISEAQSIPSTSLSLLVRRTSTALSAKVVIEKPLICAVPAASLGCQCAQLSKRSLRRREEHDAAVEGVGPAYIGRSPERTGGQREERLDGALCESESTSAEYEGAYMLQTTHEKQRIGIEKEDAMVARQSPRVQLAQRSSSSFAQFRSTCGE